MIGTVYCEAGEGFADRMVSLIGLNKTLYIGMKSTILSRQEHWLFQNVTYSSIYKLEYPLSDFRLVIVELFQFVPMSKRDMQLVKYLASSCKPNILIRHCKNVDKLVQAVMNER